MNELNHKAYTPSDIYKLQMENELLKYELRFLKLGRSRPNNQIGTKTQAYKDLIALLGFFRRPGIVNVCRKNKTFVRVENRYFDSNGKGVITSDLNFRANNDITSILEYLAATKAVYLFRCNETYRKLENRYLK